jgi:hypothetical protein
MLIKRYLAIFASIAVVFAAVLQFNPASAATVTVPATANISSDSVSGASVSLPAMVITETAAADIPVGTLSWTLPSGYMFDTASVANVAYTGTGLAGGSTVAFNGTTGFSVTVTATSTVAGSLTVGSVTPLKVKATSGTTAAAGNIMLTSGSITGVVSTTSFGLLTQVPGAANKLAFTTQPPANVVVGVNFGTTVSVEDQFGNVVGSDNSRNVVLSANLIASTTSGSLSGTLNTNDASGVASFTGLSFSTPNQITITASSTGLAATVSSMVTIATTTPTPTPTPTVTPTPTPTPTSCTLRNGILVKVAGSPTVYMVVNCVLRPFNTPAIFHAKGKKFEDIEDVPSLNLGIGKPVGDGDDNDSTIIIPAGSSTSTPPSITGLPDGSIVKVAGNPTIYIVTGGVLQPFTSPVVFKSHKKSFNQVKTISAAQFASLSVGAPANFPDGTLLKGSDNTVYVVEGGQLFGIPNPQVLKNHGWSFSSVLHVGNGDLNGLHHGGNEQ